MNREQTVFTFLFAVSQLLDLLTRSIEQNIEEYDKCLMFDRNC